MSDVRHHAEWLSLMEVSGPFLAEPVLKEAFPQGLAGLDGAKKKMIRQAYDEWREAIDLDEPDVRRVHRAWIELVLGKGLELDEDGTGDVLKTGGDGAAIRCGLPEYGIELTPDFVVTHGQGSPLPLMLVSVYDPEIVLGEAFKQGTWSASPAERMVTLCRATGVRLGLVTNGEQWMLVDAPVGAVITLASWYARLWSQEPTTLQAFVNLLGIRRFFVDRAEQLPALLDNSVKFQDEVTDALGEQVRRAVEVLIQALDRAHVDSGQTLLDGVEPTELYEAGLTVMMRIVFLLSAEERGLLLMGDELYEANYAVSTLRLQLRAESEEILERRWDAWSRLLSLFRAVYGGIDHAALRLPALGGSLFDPDRFPFLEGRPRGSRWKLDLARPLPIDNRTVMLLLEAVQLFRGRTLSYMALDVEQIGYVYEGLLERKVVRATEPTLDLDGTKNAKNPWVTLAELEDAEARGGTAIEELLKERMGSSQGRIRNDLTQAVNETETDKLLTACHADRSLHDRVKPYFHLIRTDPWGYPLVYPEGTFTVTTGGDRRETGAHYTPKSLTEVIVKETLEPVAYSGPSDGLAREKWQLKTPAELLNLKICDPAMGSGAFLVQSCRWLAERLVEAWAQTESTGNIVDAQGTVHDHNFSGEPLRGDLEERLILARRLVAERCLYGVDLNPLAVELAKLSIWLVTLAKGRPFGFLDHNIKRGDSLLGISQLEQLRHLHLDPPNAHSKSLFALEMGRAVDQAIEYRFELRHQPIRDILDIRRMVSLDEQARLAVETSMLVADALIGEYLAAGSKAVDLASLSIDVGNALAEGKSGTSRLRAATHSRLNQDSHRSSTERHPFHSPLEFPEVFLRDDSGFDAIVGNPPYMGASKISGRLGSNFKAFLSSQIAAGRTGLADFCVYFMLRACSLLRKAGAYGVIATSSVTEGDFRAVGLDALLSSGWILFRAVSRAKWPGMASVTYVQLYLCNRWSEFRSLDSKSVALIPSTLTIGERIIEKPSRLPFNTSVSFNGVKIYGNGFVIPQLEAEQLLALSSKNAAVIYPYLTAAEVNSSPSHQGSRFVIRFFEWPLDRATAPASYNGPVAADFPDCLNIVLERVFPERTRKKDNGSFALEKPLPQKWWIYGRPRPKLYAAISKLDECMVIATQATKYAAFVLVDTKQVFSHSLAIIASDDRALFGVLNSSIHDLWSRHFGSYNLALLRYSPSDLFETFPLPSNLGVLTSIGEEYQIFRDNLMKICQCGLTDILNEFHDPTVVSKDATAFRNLQMKLDYCVISSYGWSDIELDHNFVETKDGLRYTVSSVAREELLYRLSQLNKSETDKVLRAGNNTFRIGCDQSEASLFSPEGLERSGPMKIL